MTTRKHKCALNGCKKPADKWTMCDPCADSMGIYVHRNKKVINPSRLVHLSGDVWAQIKNSLTVNSASSMSRIIGVSNSPVLRIRDSAVSLPLDRRIANKITEWADAGAPAPQRRKPKCDANARQPVQQHHIDIIWEAVRRNGGFVGAGREIGLSRSVLDNTAKRRKPGDLAAPETLELIEAWGKSAGIKIGEALSDRYDRRVA